MLCAPRRGRIFYGGCRRRKRDLKDPGQHAGSLRADPPHFRDPRPHRPCTRHRLDDPHDRNKDEKGPVYRGRPHLLPRRADRDDQNTLPPDNPG